MLVVGARDLDGAPPGGRGRARRVARGADLLSTAMTETLGFWKIARGGPGPDRRDRPDRAQVVSYGELFAEANRLVHGLRALGLRAGRRRGRRAAQRHRAARASTSRPCRPAGTSRRSTTTSSDPRSPTSWTTATRPPSSVHERFAARGRGAAERSRSPEERRFAVGDGRRASDRYAELTDGQPDDAPGRALGRRADALHVGHHRQAEGRAAPPLGSRPRRGRGHGRWLPRRCSASSPTTTTSTSAGRRSTTPPCSSSRRRRCTSATPSC